MRFKTLMRLFLLAGGIAGIAFFTLSGALPQTVAVSSRDADTDSNLPARLIIPNIGIDAAIEYVDVVADGSMDVPKAPDHVAWFEPGARPGENGNAVIAGHSGWRNGIPAAFDTLHRLRKGDLVYVQDEKGNVTTFIVRELRTYPPTADASDVFNVSDGEPHLNLITCSGSWNEILQEYSDRLVVFTDRM